MTLLIGIVLGWIFHWVWIQDDSQITTLHSSNEVANHTDISHQDMTNPSRGESTTSVPAIAPESVWKADQEKCLDDGDYYLTCRNSLLAFARSANPKSEVISHLKRWLTEYPDDLDAGLILVDILVSDRQFMPAIAELENLKDYQFDFDGLALFVGKVESLIRMTSRMFRDNNEPEGLISLYQLLIDVDAQNPRWRYEQASLISSLGQHQRALDLLSYILYDAEYGEKATTLHHQINQIVSTPSNVDVPLVGTGSQFLVEAVINEVTSLKLLVDTGASITSINKNILARYIQQGASTSRATLQTANGKVDTKLVTLRSLRVGDFAVHDLNAAEIDSLGENLDGLLGMDFLGQFKFAIDQERRVLFLDQRGYPQ
ncbi:MAG: aspartyl protease family protein [Acidiferrobacterales bacterium]|nr:aspartyl protease family protein [Acidiferrobacterales bacterium]